MKMNQRTLINPIAFIGKGLFANKDVEVMVYPAKANSGISFKIQGCNKTRLLLKIDRMGGYYTSSCFSTGKGNIVMVEHLLSALVGNGIYNADIVIKPAFLFLKPKKGSPANNFDIPLLDGSALPLVNALRNNIKELPVPQRFIVPKETIYFSESKSFYNSFVEISPCKEENELNYYLLHMDELRAINQGFKISNCTDIVYNNEIAPCRTYGSIAYNKEIYQGANEENCIGYDYFTGAIYQGEGWLRFPDELIRHKLLDMIGDFAVLGYPLRARIEAANPGHDFNRHFCTYLLKNCRDKFEIKEE